MEIWSKGSLMRKEKTGERIHPIFLIIIWNANSILQVRKCNNTLPGQLNLSMFRCVRVPSVRSRKREGRILSLVFSMTRTAYVKEGGSEIKDVRWEEKKAEECTASSVWSLFQMRARCVQDTNQEFLRSHAFHRQDKEVMPKIICFCARKYFGEDSQYD